MFISFFLSKHYSLLKYFFSVYPVTGVVILMTTFTLVLVFCKVTALLLE